MKEKINKLSIGFITYNDMTAKYLPYFLPSLLSQDRLDFNILVADNSENEQNENSEYIKTNYPNIDLKWMGSNIGFAKAYNKLIEKAKSMGSEYFMVINPDTLLEDDTISLLLSKLETEENLSSVCPKIMYWNFSNKTKTNVIDSYGLDMIKPMRFYDIFQGEIDNNHSLPTRVLGPSGAAGMFRISSLDKVKDEFGYFDERMFMYKEDCDLAYRLYKAGLRSEVVNDSLVYHDRSVRKQRGGLFDFIRNRNSKSLNVRKWSFRNQQIIFCKHWKGLSFLEKFSVVFYQVKQLIYVSFFEPFLIKELIDLKKTIKK